MVNAKALMKVINEFTRSLKAKETGEGFPFVNFVDDAEDWVRKIMWECHQGKLPDDYVFYIVKELADNIKEEIENIDEDPIRESDIEEALQRAIDFTVPQDFKNLRYFVENNLAETEALLESGEVRTITEASARYIDEVGHILMNGLMAQAEKLEEEDDLKDELSDNLSLS